MIGFRGLADRVGDKWRNMSEDEKAPYTDMYLDDRDRYRAELKIWKKNKKRLMLLSGIPTKRKEEKKKRNTKLFQSLISN